MIVNAMIIFPGSGINHDSTDPETPNDDVAQMRIKPRNCDLVRGWVIYAHHAAPSILRPTSSV